MSRTSGSASESEEVSELADAQKDAIAQVAQELASMEFVLTRLADQLTHLPDGIERTTLLRPEQAAAVDAARSLVRLRQYNKIRQGLLLGQLIPHICMPTPNACLRILRTMAFTQSEKKCDAVLSATILREGWRILPGTTSTSFDLFDAANRLRAGIFYTWSEDNPEGALGATFLRTRYLVTEAPIKVADGSPEDSKRCIAFDRATCRIVVIGDAVPKQIGVGRWQDGEKVITTLTAFEKAVELKKKRVEKQLSLLVDDWEAGFDGAAWNAPALPAASLEKLQS